MIGRVLITLFGGGIIALALLLGQRETIGFEASSVGQITLIAFGALFVILGVAGKRLSTRKLVKGYGQFAVILLNTLLFLVVLELFILLSFNAQFVTRNQELVTADESLAVYQGADWLPTFQREDQEAWNPRYSYFDLWTNRAYQGETVNITEDGTRLTPGAECDGDSYRIYVYGGSTIWGSGVPDWGTIPAYLQAALSEQLDRNVCVVNYGEKSFVSTQEMIRLIKQLQRGDVPDMVIFYDGINETIAAHNAGEAGAHRELGTFTNAMNSRPPHPLVSWLTNTYLVRFVRAIAAPAQETDEVDYAALSEEIAEIYLNNVRMTNVLAAEYGFEPVFIWQPISVVGDKPLTDEEVVMTQVIPPTLLTVYQTTWANVEGRQDEVENLYYIADVFDEVEAPVYFDHHHLAPQGNEIVADRIVEIIAPTIEAQRTQG